MVTYLCPKCSSEDEIADKIEKEGFYKIPCPACDGKGYHEFNPYIVRSKGVVIYRKGGKREECWMCLGKGFIVKKPETQDLKRKDKNWSYSKVGGELYI